MALERRPAESWKEPYIATARSVRVTILDKEGCSMQADAIHLSGRGLRLQTPFQIPAGTAVRIDGENTLSLGEVCYCHPTESRYAVGITLDQALTGLQDFEQLMGACWGKRAGKPGQRLRR